MNPRIVVLLVAGAALGANADPVKQAREALSAGEDAVTKAGKSCRDNEYEQCETLLRETRTSVETAKDSLDKSGINPSRSPKHFKEAEIRTRKILKLLRSLESYIHPDDQTLFDSVVRRVSDINDQLLSAIMSKGKKR